jgi:protein gp37
MAEGNIGISWTDEAMNSLFGCQECSKGCDHCYARMRVYRFSRDKKRANRDKRYSGLVEISKRPLSRDSVESGKKDLRFTGKILFNPAKLYAFDNKSHFPRSLVFVDEFSDLLHRAVPMDVILEHFRVFRGATGRQFQILTKRANRLGELDAAVIKAFGEWPQNVWMGVSVCTPQKGELKKIAALAKIHARIKWVSFEPWLSDSKMALEEACPNLADLLGDSGITWSVIGGESGSKKDSRLMAFEDAQYLFSSSEEAACRVHFKQLGTQLAIKRGVYGIGDHRAKGGNLEQIPPNLRKREWPENVSWDAPEYDPSFELHFDKKKWIQFE